jgi:uncharacterized protein with von Willebrand factor type A (vWA) domain
VKRNKEFVFNLYMITERLNTLQNMFISVLYYIHTKSDLAEFMLKQSYEYFKRLGEDIEELMDLWEEKKEEEDINKAIVETSKEVFQS